MSIEILYNVHFIAILDGKHFEAGQDWMPIPKVGDVFTETNKPTFKVTKIVYANFNKRTVEVEGVFL